MPLGLPAPSYMSPGAVGRTGQGGGSNGTTPTPTGTTTSGAPSSSPPANNPYTYADDFTRQMQEEQRRQQQGYQLPQSETDNVIDFTQKVPNSQGVPYGVADSAAAMNDWYKQQAMLSQAASDQSATNNFLRMQNKLGYLSGSADHINATYGNDSALLDAQRRAQVDLAGQQLGIDRNYAQAMWDNLQSDITNKRGTAKEQLAIQNWLTGRNREHTTTERDLNFAQNRATYDTRMRQLGYAATGAGAYTSAGHRADRRDAGIAGFLGNANANLGYNRSMDQLTAGERNNALSYRSTLDSLQNQYNNGLAGYNRDMSGFGVQQAGINNTAGQFDIRANQLGLDRNQALNQNTWNQQQALWGAIDRNSSIAQQQAQYLANLAAQVYAGG